MHVYMQILYYDIHSYDSLPASFGLSNQARALGESGKVFVQSYMTRRRAMAARSNRRDALTAYMHDRAMTTTGVFWARDRL
jgi:hypothetical protein